MLRCTARWHWPRGFALRDSFLSSRCNLQGHGRAARSEPGHLHSRPHCSVCLELSSYEEEYRETFKIGPGPKSLLATEPAPKAHS
jgi:hypothetical protein